MVSEEDLCDYCEERHVWIRILNPMEIKVCSERECMETALEQIGDLI